MLGSQFFLPLHAYHWTSCVCGLAICHSAVDSSKGISTHFDLGHISCYFVLICLYIGEVLIFREKGGMCPYRESGPVDRRAEGPQVSVGHIDSRLRRSLSLGG